MSQVLALNLIRSNAIISKGLYSRHILSHTLNLPYGKDFTMDETEKQSESTKTADSVAKQRPNHFLAIKISHPEVRLKAESLQRHIVSTRPDLKKSLVDLRTLHITLKVLYINNETELLRVLDAMEKAIPQLTKVVGDRLDLVLHGVGHFKKQVLFVKVREKHEPTKLGKIIEVIDSIMEESGTKWQDGAFIPHVTVAKLSKLSYKKRKKCRLDEDIWNEYQNEQFGEERVSEISLLQMDQKDDHGYYSCHGIFKLVDDEEIQAISSFPNLEKICEELKIAKDLARKNIRSACAILSKIRS